MSATFGVSRVAAHAARCPPALWPIATTRLRSTGRSASRSIAADTSSSVVGTPPPLPSRRYSMFHAAHPRAARSSASGSIRSSPYWSFQNPPWMSTATGPSPYSTPYCEGSSPYL